MLEAKWMLVLTIMQNTCSHNKWQTSLFISFMENVAAAAIVLETRLQTGACIDPTFCDWTIWLKLFFFQFPKMLNIFTSWIVTRLSVNPKMPPLWRKTWSKEFFLSSTVSCQVEICASTFSIVWWAGLFFIWSLASCPPPWLPFLDRELWLFM